MILASIRALGHTKEMFHEKNGTDIGENGAKNLTSFMAYTIDFLL